MSRGRPRKVVKDDRKVSVYMSADLYEWFKDVAKEIGIPVSTYMAVVLSDHKDEKDVYRKLYRSFFHDAKNFGRKDKCENVQR